MNTRNLRKALLGGALSLSVALAAGSAAAQADDTWPADGIDWLVASSAGGATDTVTRALQPYMSRLLDTTMRVENKSGGGNTAAGPLVKRDTTCNTIVTWAIPALLLNTMVQNVDFTPDDLYPVGRISYDPSAIIVGLDTPYKTLQDLIDDAKARPGEITAAIGSIGSDMKNIMNLEQAAGIKFNIVPLGGGSQARNAVVGGQAPLTEGGIYASQNIASQVRYLAVQAPNNPRPDLTQNAPTLPEALNGAGTEPHGSAQGLFVSKSCHDEQPERYQKLVDALKASIEDPEFTATVEKLNAVGYYAYLPPEEFGQQLDAALPGLKTFYEEHMKGK